MITFIQLPFLYQDRRKKETRKTELMRNPIVSKVTNIIGI